MEHETDYSHTMKICNSCPATSINLETTGDIGQLDGNDTLSSISEFDSSIESDSSSISITQTNDQFTSLPTIYSANARSVFPKVKDLMQKLQNNRIDIAQISETWQDINKKDHKADAAPSDHLGNLLIPRSIPGVPSSRVYRTLLIRPLTESQIAAIGRWIATESWSHLQTVLDFDSQLDHFTSSVFIMLNTVDPEKEVKISLDDPPWMNTRIKTTIRQRNREFDKNVKTDKWRKLMKKCKSMVKKAKKNFATNFISNLKDTDPSTWMKRMDKLGRASYQAEQAGWHFQTESMTDQELTDEMADYFANISNDFTPVDPSLLDLVPPGAPFVSEVECLPTEL